MRRYNARVRIAVLAILAAVTTAGCGVMRWEIDGLKADLAAERAAHRDHDRR